MKSFTKKLEEKNNESVELQDISGHTKATLEDEPDFESRKKSLNLRRLQESAVISYTYILERAMDLGISLGQFSPEAILYEKLQKDVTGCYDANSNSIKISDHDNQSLRLVLHEQLHYSTSSKNKTESSDFNGKRYYQSGFHSVWEPRREGEDSRDILRSLNEAITEKLAREIASINKERFLDDFKNRSPEIIRAKIKLAEDKKYFAIKKAQINYNLAIEYSMNPEDDEIIFGAIKKESLNYAEEEYIKDMKDALYSYFISEDYESYQDEIDILNEIIKKLAVHSSDKDGIDLDKAVEKEWFNLQKAYFEGNTVYLRKIEKIIGLGTLSSFNNINRSS